MSFSGDLRNFSLKLSARNREVFVGCVEEVTRSVVEGSEITASPGQPVDTGNLRASWHTTYESPTLATVATNVEYAPYVEENVRGVTFKNHGPHSVALTVAGFGRIVDTVVKRTVK